jgi:hypothetical protein
VIVHPTPFTGSAVIATTAKRYVGFSIRETAGSTAVVRVWDSAVGATGAVMEEIALASHESSHEYYSGGITTPGQTGLYVEVESGTVAGSIRREA